MRNKDLYYWLLEDEKKEWGLEELVGFIAMKFRVALRASDLPYGYEIASCLDNDNKFAADLVANPNKSLVDKIYECFKTQGKAEQSRENEIKEQIYNTIVEVVKKLSQDPQVKQKIDRFIELSGGKMGIFKRVYEGIKGLLDKIKVYKDMFFDKVKTNKYFIKAKENKIATGLIIVAIFVALIILVKKVPVIGKFFGAILRGITFPFRWLLSKFRRSPEEVTALFEQFLYNPEVRRLIESYNRRIEAYYMLYSMV